MKLYATTTSERASKGQGGNKYLNIDIFMGSAKNSIKILEGTITQENDGYVVYFTTLTEGENNQCIDTFIKGNKQKTAKCLKCDKELYENLDHKGICPKL